MSTRLLCGHYSQPPVEADRWEHDRCGTGRRAPVEAAQAAGAGNG